VVNSMSRRRRKAQGTRSATGKSAVATKPASAFVADGPLDVAVRYAEACGLATQGKIDEAGRIYAELDAVLAGAEPEVRIRALVRSDLAALAATEGRFDEAREGWQAALEIDPDCLMARLNRDLIEAELSFGQMSGDLGELKLAPAPLPSPLVGEGGPKGRMGGVGLRGADSQLATLIGSAPPHPRFGHPLPERGEGESESRVLSFIGPPPLAPPFTRVESYLARSHA
jgi:tetratricopeptide (TPR) repeat protein